MTDEQALKILNRMDTLGNAQLEAALDVAAEALRERIERAPADDVAPGEAVREAEKLIRTMKNNKKAALWLKQYGKDEDNGTCK